MRTSEIKIAKCPKTITPQEREIVLKYTKLCMKELSKKKYDLPPLDPKKLRLIIGVGHASWAEDGTVSIGIKSWRDKEVKFEEYDSFAKDPVIGTIYDVHSEVVMAAIIAHEIAHHIQDEYCPRSKVYNDWKKPHGTTFRIIYSFLRSVIVNPMVRESRGSIGERECPLF